MSKICEPPAAKLIISIFSGKISLLDSTISLLSKEFGPVDFTSAILEFKHTDYYENEFGINLKRKFISFESLIAPQELWRIKQSTNKLEETLACEKKRSVNIDPGYLTQASLVLASTKNFSHRIEP